MNDSDLHDGLHDYYESITPADSARATALVDQAIRAKRERSEKSRQWRPVFAIAAAVAIVAAFVAVPFVFRPAVVPSVSSSPTVSTSPSLPPASASPTPVGDWKVLAASAGVGASWSPDGKWLAVWDEFVSGQTQDLRLLDRAGNPVRSLDGDRLVWLNATQFVLSRASSSFLGSVDSTVVTPIASTIPAGALSNNHGAVAITTVQPLDPAKTSFVVWTQAGTSRVVIGEPEAWSPDGTKLAVWHSTAPPGPLGIGYQATGWVEVLSWPDLRSVGSLKSDSFVPQTSFDPSGRYLLAFHLGLAGFSILDLATGQTVGPSGVTGSPAWDNSGNLLVSATDGSVTTYPISGVPATTQAGVGDGIASSTDGSTVVLYFSQDYSPNPRPIALIRNGVSRRIVVPGGLESAPVISPDGSGIVVVCLVHHLLPSEETEALLLSASAPEPTTSPSETSPPSVAPSPIGTPRPGDSEIALATARAYEDDLLNGKFQDAWNMLTPEYQAGMISFSDWESSEAAVVRSSHYYTLGEPSHDWASYNPDLPSAYHGDFSRAFLIHEQWGDVPAPGTYALMIVFPNDQGRWVISFDPLVMN
jgi:hypothetical protein